MPNLAFYSATKLAALIRKREISSEELLACYLSRAEKYNPRLNAIVATDIPAARKRAREADAALRRNEVWGPFHGVPITIKDSLDVVGMPSTWGVPELKQNYPARHALVVERFLNAGAIVLGKTNVAAYLIGWITKNDLYGTTNNPWDLKRSPGGSSGGAAAALAAGLTALDIGVDFGGGVRNVAHFCSVWGHKPTYGITNLIGNVMPGIGSRPDLAVIGPMARSTEDLKLALSLMTGPDPTDAIAWSLNLPPPRRDTAKGLRVAVMLEHPAFPVEEEVKDRIHATGEFLRRNGAEVDEAGRPSLDMQAAFRVFIGLLVAPLAARRKDEQFWSRLSHLTAYCFGEDNIFKDPVGYSHAEWLVMNNARHMIRRVWEEFFKDFDLFLCPAAAYAAQLHDEKRNWHQMQLQVAGRPLSVVDATFWGAMATLAQLPATVAPAGLTPAGLPVGVQIIGPEYGDNTCLAIAQFLERHFQGFVSPPGLGIEDHPSGRGLN